MHLGFEVRVELALPGDRDLWAQVTRDECAELGLERGVTVYVRPRRAKIFN